MPYRVSVGASRRNENGRPGWTRQALPQELGECHVDSLSIGADLRLSRTDYRPRRDLTEDSLKDLERPVLAVTLGLAGESCYRGRCGTELVFRSGCTTISTFRCIQGERQYRCSGKVKQLRLLVGENTLRHYLGESSCRQLLDGGRGVQQLSQHPTTQAGLIHANTLLWQIEEAPTNILQTHIHALSLLAEELRHLGLPSRPHESRLSQRDAAKLDQARQYLETHMGRNLTVNDVAVAVGISESKLRDGFRQRYNQSPHRLLLELRMQKAWTMLETGCQVAEAAYAVGYEHPSNFSAAFTRFFGRAPKSVFGPRHRGE